MSWQGLFFPLLQLSYNTMYSAFCNVDTIEDVKGSDEQKVSMTQAWR